jgi:tetratricopeptide (TPR) repeat protein
MDRRIVRLGNDRGRVARALIIGVLAVSAARADGGRVSGKVVDDKGNPANGVSLIFVADPGPGRTVPPVEVKKGRFAIGNFPEGPYRIDLGNAPYTIRHFTVEMRGGDGVMIDKLDVDVAQGQPAPAFQVSPSQRADVTLTLGPPLTDVQGRAVGIQTAAATSAALRKLNELFAAGDMKAVLAEADRLLADDPKLGGAHYSRAVALWKLGRPGEAVESMRKAVEFIPEQPGIDGVAGAILMDLGDQEKKAGNDEKAKKAWTDAAEAFGREVAKSPNDSAALTNRVIALDRAGNVDESIAALNALIAKDPGNAKAILRLAEVESDAGRLEEALAVLDRMPNPNADTANAIYNVSVKLYNAKKLEPIVPAMQKAIRIAPEIPHTHQLLARVLLNQGDVPGAVREMKEFLRLAPNDPDAASEREMLKAIE